MMAIISCTLPTLLGFHLPLCMKPRFNFDVTVILVATTQFCGCNLLLKSFLIMPSSKMLPKISQTMIPNGGGSLKATISSFPSQVGWGYCTQISLVPTGLRSRACKGESTLIANSSPTLDMNPTPPLPSILPLLKTITSNCLF